MTTSTPTFRTDYSSAAQDMYKSLSPAQQATLQKGSPEMFSRLSNNTTDTSSNSTTNPVITPTKDVGTETPVDETTIRNNELAKRENQFNAIDALYSRRIADVTKAETEAGARDMARANTIAAMTGMSGSVNAASNQSEIDKKTKDTIQAKTDALNNEKLMAISGIYDKIDQNVLREKEIQANKSAVDRKALIDKMNTDANNNIMSFATHGITWDKAMSDPTFASEVKRTGKDPFTLQKEYEVSRAANNAQMTNFSTKVQGNSVVSSWVDTDPVTGKHTPKFEVTPLPAGAQSFTSSHYDPATGKLILWDNAGNSKVTTINGDAGGTDIKPTKADLSGAVTWMRAQSDYTSEMEQQFNSDPVIQAKVIQAWKASKSSANSM